MKTLSLRKAHLVSPLPALILSKLLSHDPAPFSSALTKNPFVSFSIVGVATLATRLSGFARDILMAAVLGTSGMAEVFIAAFLIPNLLRRILGEGAFNYTIIPHFLALESADRQNNHREAAAFITRLFWKLSLAVIFCLLIFWLFTPDFMHYLAPQLMAQQSTAPALILFSRLAFSFSALVIVSAFLAALLNAREKYSLAACLPFAMNMMLVITLIFLILSGNPDHFQAALYLSLVSLFSGIAQLCLMLWGAQNQGFLRQSHAFSIAHQPTHSARTLIFPAFLIILITGANHIYLSVISLFASGHSGALGALYYADRFAQLPLSFIATAIGTVLLPRFTKQMQDGDINAATNEQSQAMHYALLLILPASLALYILAEPIIGTLFQRGAFSASNTHEVAGFLSLLSLAMPAFVLIKIISTGFMAKKQIKWPLIAMLTGLAVGILIAALAPKMLGARAFGWAVVLSAWMNALVLMVAGVKTKHFAFSAQLLRRLPAIFAATLFMGAAIMASLPLLAPILSSDANFILKAMILSLLCGGGMLIYGLSAVVLRAVDFKKHA